MNAQRLFRLHRHASSLALFVAAVLAGCTRQPARVEAGSPTASSTAEQPLQPGASGKHASGKQAVGFDRNDYPGDAAMGQMHQTFAFAGYWLTTPPGATTNTWTAKRATLRAQGWGFLVLANGKLDAEILKARKAGLPPAELGHRDAVEAVAAARREGFPAHAIVFLDQEEGGRLLDEQAAYLLGWTEAVAATEFRPGVYASGQPVSDAPGTTIDTIRDIRERVRTGKLHEIAMFDAQDSCPPAPGCTVQAHPLDAAGEPDLIAWQYAQSPRRPEITRSCAKTYAADGSCYAPGSAQIFLDMDVAVSGDPSNGR